ncbi:biopolymer transporter ExbD [Polaribacter sp. Hel_I_88]|uniref:ExbD/TolR family protein n=1 Tax=Polaribacter sp. Hel_I_88 TaxID=1250006 RepID=UPI00047BDD0B|nr:biopolymer transporter ExbD [Polaribacter sp. Hel_I_88]
MSRKKSPEINAGSMADIAFLLLIFFLVTTTMNVDAGISKKIPEKPIHDIPFNIKEKNVLEVNINFNNELFVDGKIIELKELKQIAIQFIDNGAGFDNNQQPCNWCEGERLETSSDHPSKAIISIETDRNTKYETYIATLDKLNSSYAFLRNKLAIKLYNTNYESLIDAYKKSNYSNESIGNKIKVIKDKYPVLISDVEINN